MSEQKKFYDATQKELKVRNFADRDAVYFGYDATQKELKDSGRVQAWGDKLIVPDATQKELKVGEAVGAPPAVSISDATQKELKAAVGSQPHPAEAQPGCNSERIERIQVSLEVDFSFYAKLMQLRKN